MDYIVSTADRGKAAYREMQETNLKTFRASAETYMNVGADCNAAQQATLTVAPEISYSHKKIL